jgi:hypothetical protein
MAMSNPDSNFGPGHVTLDARELAAEVTLSAEARDISTTANTGRFHRSWVILTVNT